MNLDSLLDPRNPGMALIWKFASDLHQFKKKSIKQYKEILTVDVADICVKLMKFMTGQNKQVNSQAYFRSSMVASGALRLHNNQTSILLDDTKKLLEVMRREKKAVESLAEELDCIVSHTEGVEPGAIELLFDETPLKATPRAIRPAVAPFTTTISATVAPAARVQPIDWGSLDGDIDWAQGPPRACIHQITLPDADVSPSTEYAAELERLRVLEGSFEGPTLLDWEEFSREGSPQLAERTRHSIDGAQVDTLVPVETEEPTLPRIVMEEVPDVLPPVVEEFEPPVAQQPDAAEPQASPQTPVEQPSQIELAPLQGRQEQKRQVRKVKRVRPIMDLVTYLSTDMMKLQIQSHHDTLRNTTSSLEVVNLEMLKLQMADFFSPKPLHCKVMADTLLKLFLPCDGEAVFPESESPLPEIVRAASHVEERDLSAVPSLLQDTSTERSTLIEAPTGLFEEVPFPLQPIEEHEMPAPVTLSPPPPPPPAGDVTPLAKEQTTQKLKHLKTDKDADIGRTYHPTREFDASKKTPHKASGSETSKEDLLGIRGEEMELSELLDLAEPEVLARMVLDFLATHHETFFTDLLPQNPTDNDAGHLFDHLLQMYKDSKLRLVQDQVFGPIKVDLVLVTDH